MHVKLSENFRAVFYAPFYATHALGFYTGEGVDVELLNSPAPAAAAAGLLDGSIDICVGRADARDEGSRRRSPFAAGLLLRGRGARSVLSGRQGRSFDISARRSAAAEDRDRVGGADALALSPARPAHCKASIRRRLNRVADRTMADNLEALRRGELDVVQMFEPYVSMALQDGRGRGSLCGELARADGLYDVPRQPRQRSPQPRGLRRHGAGHPPHAGLGCGAQRGGIGGRGCAVLPGRSSREFWQARFSATGMRDFGRARQKYRGRGSRGWPTA